MKGMMIMMAGGKKEDEFERNPMEDDQSDKDSNRDLELVSEKSQNEEIEDNFKISLFAKIRQLEIDKEINQKYTRKDVTTIIDKVIDNKLNNKPLKEIAP